MGKSSAGLRIVTGAALLAALPACTWVVGWADLQTSRKSDGGGTADASEPPADASKDGPPVDGVPGEAGASWVTCGSTACDGVNTGCCIADPSSPSSPRACKSFPSCGSGSGGAAYVTCSTAAECAARSPGSGVCCYDFATSIASCRSSCGMMGGTFVMCDFVLDPNCPGGQSCTQIWLPPPYGTCQ